jgi:two-component system LytT family sensor kinase
VVAALGHLGAAIGISLIHSALYFSVRQLFLGHAGEPGQDLHTAWLSSLSFFTTLDALVYTATALAVRAWHDAEDAGRQKEVAADLQERVGNAALQRARLLLQPLMVEEFLLRIEELIVVDGRKAEQLIEQLAGLLRRSLAALRPDHRLADELRHAEAFLAAERSLHGPGPEVRFGFCSGDTAATLQPLMPILAEVLAACRRCGEIDVPIEVDVRMPGDWLDLELRMGQATAADPELLRALGTIRASMPPGALDLDGDRGVIHCRAGVHAPSADPVIVPPTRPERFRPISSPLALALLLAFGPFVTVAANALDLLQRSFQRLPIDWTALDLGLRERLVIWPILLIVVWTSARVLARSRNDRGQPRWVWLAALAVLPPALPFFAWFTAQRLGLTGAVANALHEETISGDRTVDFLVSFGAAVTLIAHRRYRELEGRQHEVRALRGRLQEARLELLRLQLNPHFLFNTLNSIAALLEDEPAAATAMAAQLRRFLRRVLELSSEMLVPLGTELELLRDYIAIEKARFGERLAISLDIDPAALACRVPALLLQPLVENAVKHGLAPTGGGSLAIAATRAGAQLRMRVADNGVGADETTEAEGIGLATTRMRLQQYYGNLASVRITNLPVGYSVTITLPAETA